MVIKVLNVAEKPSVAKAVASILSRGQMQSRSGRSPYNRIFEFSYTIGSQQCDMRMTSVTGHLMELEFEDRYRSWHSCDPSALYEAPVIKTVPQSKTALKQTLEEEARSCQWLVLWLDCDREGENIAFEVLQVCLRSNRNLNVWRAKFSALVDRDIHAATQNLGRPNERFADAVDARQEVDLRIGASFTRFQTLLLQDRYIIPGMDEGKKQVISYGPCQFPTLGFVVERYWQIEAHVAEDFWSIHCVYNDKKDNVTATFSWLRGRLFDHLAATVLYEMCVENPTATVIDVDGQERRKFPPYPLNTVELTKRASRFLHMSSEHTMKIAEELYQSGFMSYPRTETDSFQEGMDLKGLVSEQVQHPSWGPFAARLLSDGPDSIWRDPGNGGHDDGAHPAIHPTKFSTGEPHWSTDHARLYELVVRHFLASVCQPGIGYETSALIDIAGEKFRAKGLMITARNYLDVYRYDSWGASNIPIFQIGQKFVPTELTLRQSKTEPPPLLSEADLIGLMDKAGIGTDATMHDHIKKLLDRGYVTKDSNTRFKPTKFGEALVMGYDLMGHELWKPALRAAMEGDMRAVSEGRKSKAQVLGDTLNKTKECFLDAKAQKAKLEEAMGWFFERRQGGDELQRSTAAFVGPCRSVGCDGGLGLKARQGGGFMVGCSAYPQCRNVVWLPSAVTEASVVEENCATCHNGAFKKIDLKFRRSDIPAQFDTRHRACVGGCDTVLQSIISICGTRGSSATTPANNTHHSNGSRRFNDPSTSNRGRSGARGGGRGRGGERSSNGIAMERSSSTCYKCGNEGHWASSCPQNGTTNEHDSPHGSVRGGASRGRGHGLRNLIDVDSFEIPSRGRDRGRRGRRNVRGKGV